MKYKVREVLTEAQVAFGFLPDDAREGEADTYNVYDGLSNAGFNHAVDVVVNQWITDGLEEDVTVEVTDEDGEVKRFFVMITNRPRILGIHPQEG